MTGAARWVAVACAITFVAGIAFFGVRGSDDYTVTARFETAGQLVTGNAVQVAGVAIGSVEDIRLAKDGRAEVVLRIDDDDYQPLRRGTEAIVREASLAGVANRYVDLRLPPDAAPELADGGVIGADDTTSAVELDQVMDVFDTRTRAALGRLVRSQATALDGRGRDARAALLYLNPALASANRLLGELNSDRAALRRFIVASGHLASDTAARRDDLARLVRELSRTTGAVAARSRELGDSIALAPRTLRTANSSFVNVRAALDDVEALARDARPAARRLAPFVEQLGAFARAAPPALRDVTAVARSAGRDNDLSDALVQMRRLAAIAVGRDRRAGRARDGALPETARALAGFKPAFEFLRPYGVDLAGWFDDFAHTGVYDALGGTGRIAFHVNALSLLAGQLTYVPPELRESVFSQFGQRGFGDRCPGSMERGTAFKPTPEFDCDLRQVPNGR